MNFTSAVLGTRVYGYADLIGANLCGADLRDAVLIGPGLKPGTQWGVALTNARYDAHTRWPAGFDPARHGAILMK